MPPQHGDRIVTVDQAYCYVTSRDSRHPMYRHCFDAAFSFRLQAGLTIRKQWRRFC